MSPHPTIQILETTLRDGSYVIDFQFTAEDTKRLAGALDRLGFRLIEIGHGLGINAGTAPSRLAPCSDVEWVRAAKGAAKHAKIGMFCIPGIAQLDHLKACIDAGLDFVRIGANVDEFDRTESFVSEARKRGLWVCANFMKSYAMAPEAFAKVCRRSADFGSQMLYLVDSAGGMMPEEVRRYLEAMRLAVDLPLGFHGHNNLHLAVANSLAAIDAGATIIDTTLLGMGRSSGNPPTEVMVPLLQRRYGVGKDIDPLLLVDLAEQVIAPMVKRRWEDTTKTVLGLVQVHSMYVDKIVASARERGKDPFSAIFEVGKRDRLNLSETVLAEALSAARPTGQFRDLFGDLSVVEELDAKSDLTTALRVATKLGVPVEVDVIEPGKPRDMSLDEVAVKISCQADEAVAFLEAAPDQVVVVSIAAAVAGSHPAQYQRLCRGIGRAGKFPAA